MVLKGCFNFLSPGKKMKDSKYIFDSWFDELYEDLAWDFVCKEQDNYDKAVYLAMSFLTPSEDKSEQEKIYAKIYSSKLPNQDFSCRFWQLCGAKKKKPIPHPTKLINMPLRGQVVFSVKHLFCGNVKTITCIVDEVLVEEVVQSVSAFDDFEDKDESDLESDEDF